MDTDYTHLGDVFNLLTAQVWAAITRGAFDEVERLAAQMDAVARCLDCLMKGRCPRG